MHCNSRQPDATQSLSALISSHMPVWTCSAYRLRSIKSYLFHIWCAGEQKEHSPPPGAVVIPAPATKLKLTYTTLHADRLLLKWLVTYHWPNTTSLTGFIPHSKYQIQWLSTTYIGSFQAPKSSMKSHIQTVSASKSRMQCDRAVCSDTVLRSSWQEWRYKLVCNTFIIQLQAFK